LLNKIGIYANSSPYGLGRRDPESPEEWISSTIDIALSILMHRNETKKNYGTKEFQTNELITRELLGRNIWKYSEAFGKFQGCPFWSVKAYDFYISRKKSSSISIKDMSNNLRHEHTYPQRLLIEKMKKLKNPTLKDIEELFDKYAIATIVTKEENKLLNSKEVGLRVKTISDENIWLRYNNEKIIIKIKKNPLKNRFYEFHLEKMNEAKVF
jgi:hypothetical protein|tara:strand:+ start:337 stop:972 length:636 start_codon:yes stop_codon:yes gene_type:complete